MILSGEKKEEYRAISERNTSLLFDWKKVGNTRSYLIETLLLNNEDQENKSYWSCLKEFDTVTFSNGYAKDRPQIVVELKDVRIDVGVEKWGAEKNKLYFVLMLGNVLNINT